MREKKSKKGINNSNLFYKSISILLIIVSMVFMGFLLYVDLLPLKYLALIVGFTVLFAGLNVFLLNLKKLKRNVKKILSIICLIVITLLVAGSFYIYRTLDVLHGNGDSKYKLANYSVIVLKSSDYKTLDNLKNKSIGYYKNSVGNVEAKESISKEVKINLEEFSSLETLYDSLLDSSVDAILIEDSVKNILIEESEEFSKSIRVIYTFSVKVLVKSTLKDVDVSKEPFAVYISGIDTYGEISSVSRSDVNIVMVVNPKTKQVLLISIPRDYYVQLHGTTGIKDKLTHAGIYGVEMSLQTIEDLLDLSINYYVKVNFTSVVDIVNCLGGLDVYSEYTFTSYSGYNFKKGYNSVNGEQALDFARTRKAFSDGDRQRGKNQQALIEAIIRKATSSSIISKYNSLLSAVDGKYQTNMSTKKITSLIKSQLDDMTPFNVTSYSLTGSDSSDYTYTYNQLLYVMKPDGQSVNDAIELCKKVLNGEVLESSYVAATGNSSKVTQSKVVENPPTINEQVIEKKSYTVTFDYDFNNKVETVSVDENSTVSKPTQLVESEESKYKEGYKFVGWYLGDEKYVFSKAVTEDIKLVAKWEKIIEELPDPEETLPVEPPIEKEEE